MDKFKRLRFTISLILVVVLALPGSGGETTAADSASYIVRSADAATAARLVRGAGGQVTASLALVDGVAADLTPGAVQTLRRNPQVAQVFPNARVQATGDGPAGETATNPATDYPNVVGANLVMSTTTGVSVTVAVLDTGFSNHQAIIRGIDDLNSPQQATIHTSDIKPDRVVGYADCLVIPCDDKAPLLDQNGHGTHVATIIASTHIGKDNEWNGVAPGVNLVGVRVLDRYGYGTYAQVIAGIEWVIANREALNIKVMNLSLSAPVQSPYWADPLNIAVMKAWEAGITVVAAAGNTGPAPMTVGVPGNNPYVITVGAFTDNYSPENWDDDYITPFSATGPTLDGFIKPDVIAPGAHMTAIMLPGSQLSLDHAAHRVDSQYFQMAGTSQAAGVVSGIAALVLSHRPGLTPGQVKHRLMETALVWLDAETGEPAYSVWQQGSGRVNAYDAVLAEFEGGEVDANLGLDIHADLDPDGPHYEGCSYYDEASGEVRLRDDPVCGDPVGFGKYGVWAGRYGVWATKYGVWANRYGVWADKYGVWAGKYGVWAGNYKWSEEYGVWAGKYGVWAGGYSQWGDVSVISASLPWDELAANFSQPQDIDFSTSSSSIGEWVEETILFLPLLSHD